MNTIHPLLARLTLAAAADALAAKAAFYAGPFTAAARHALGVARTTADALDDVAARCADPAAALDSLDAAVATFTRPEPGAALDMVESRARLAEGHLEAARRIREAMAEPAPRLAQVVPSFRHEPDPPVGPEVQSVEVLAPAAPPIVIDSSGVTDRVVSTLRAELAAARRLAEGTPRDADEGREHHEARGRVLGLERALSVLGARP